MANQDSQPVEGCWLAVMDAFWVGGLPALFVFGPGGASGRKLMRLPSRDVLAGLLLGRMEQVNDESAEALSEWVAQLRGWTLADYQKLPNPFRDWFGRDPRLGLAIGRADFDRWRSRPAFRYDHTALAVAVAKRLDDGDQPGRTVQWKTFCDAVRDDCAGWTNLKKGKEAKITRVSAELVRKLRMFSSSRTRATESPTRLAWK